MKQRALLLFARSASSLALFGVLLCIHLTFTLTHFLPPEANHVMNAVYIFYFLGAVLGAVLCPLFLPLPGKKRKPLVLGIGFIALLTAVEFTLRSLGVHAWVGSAAARGVMAVPEGMLTTMAYGLFYLTWLKKSRSAVPQKADEAAPQPNRTSRWCSLVFGIALLASVLSRHYSVPILERGIAAADPFNGVILVFNCIKWSMLAMGAFAALCVFLIQKVNAFTRPAEASDLTVTTNWPVILRLVGLAAVFTILNGLVNMRMLPLYYNESVYHPHFLTLAAAVLVFAFLAGRLTIGFIRKFLPPAIILFILISCLPLFEKHQQFNVVFITLIAIAHYTIWVVFTTAVVEHYSGGFWFYGMATVVFFTVAFAFLVPVAAPFVPNTMQYHVLFIAIGAALFMLLAFRMLFPKQVPANAALQPARESSATIAFEEIFRQFGLSQREIEVAHLLLQEGIQAKEMAERLDITLGTVKIHVGKIYNKFSVKNRAEFMALFVHFIA